MKEEFIAWAINANSDEGHGFIGRYWWFSKRADIPVHMEGGKVALFKTRKLASENLASVRRAFPAARDEKVVVSINTQKLTKRGPDVCPSCAGEKQVIGEDGTVWVCGICGGTGKRR